VRPHPVAFAVPAPGTPSALRCVKQREVIEDSGVRPSLVRNRTSAAAPALDFESYRDT
jgi:hypothetical protein